jgi:hypothetical protein
MQIGREQEKRNSVLGGSAVTPIDRDSEAPRPTLDLQPYVTQFLLCVFCRVWISIAGMISRLNVCMCVLLAIGGLADAQPVLKLDFNDRSGNPATNTAVGFTSFLINSNISATSPQTNATVRTFGALTVTLSGVGIDPGYNDLQRTEPPNNGAFTESLLLRDLIRSNSQVDYGGLNVLIAGLASNQLYAVTIWSFDSAGGGRRVSDWFANGELMIENYTLDGRVLPTSNDQYRFTFFARSDATGQLLIAGRRDSTSVREGGIADYGVYLNALQVEPVLRISSAEVSAGKLVMKVDSPQAALVHHLEQSSTLRGGGWTEVTSAVFSTPTNNARMVTVPGPLPSPRFYRVRY